MTHEAIAKHEFETIAPSSSEFSALQILALVSRYQKAILTGTILIAAGALFGCWILPASYKAEAIIMPPQQQQSSLASFATGALVGMSGAGSVASQFGLKNPSDLYIGILKSRTIADAIIAKFKLQDAYREGHLSDVRKKLEGRVAFTSGKDSLIVISVKDHNPKRAAALANAYVDELYSQNSRLAVTDASQRRLFYEQQLAQERDALTKAELAFKQSQQATGLLVPAGQAEVLIRSGAGIRAQIAEHEVQLQALRAYATDENASVQVLKKELGALQAQLGQLDNPHASLSKLEPSAASLPEASLEYARSLRELKYHETMYELLSKQYEASRIDEAKQAPVIQVVDRAIVPDKSTLPSIGSLIMISLLAGIVLSTLSVIGWDFAAKLRLGVLQPLEA